MAFKYLHYKGQNLERLFRKWDKILSWYEDELNDLPYWYLERTNIGHLALAVYEMSGIPIQEFTCRKGKERGVPLDELIFIFMFQADLRGPLTLTLRQNNLGVQ